MSSSRGILLNFGFSDKRLIIFSILSAVDKAAVGLSAAIKDIISFKSSSAILSSLICYLFWRINRVPDIRHDLL